MYTWIDPNYFSLWLGDDEIASSPVSLFFGVLSLSFCSSGSSSARIESFFSSSVLELSFSIDGEDGNEAADSSGLRSKVLRFSSVRFLLMAERLGLAIWPLDCGRGIEKRMSSELRWRT